MTGDSSKKFSAVRKGDGPDRFGMRDAIAVAILIAIAVVLMSRSGSRRGSELMPWPDALEYAAQAVNFDNGRGPVLHFGGYSYPSRYTEGYPLILAAAFPFIGHDVVRLYWVNIALGILAVAAIYLLAFKLFGRIPAVIAALFLIFSPIFITYSSLVLSDVPTMTMTMLAAYTFARCAEQEAEAVGAVTWYASCAVFGLIAGFSAIMRPTNSMIVGAAAVAILLVPPADRKLPKIAFAAGIFLVAFSIMPLVQLHTNAIWLGGAFASGYGWWVPEVYAAGHSPFSAAHFFGPTMPRNPIGNVPVYVADLMGLDGVLGQQGDARYFLYPFPVAMFAGIGIASAFRRGSILVRRILVFGLMLLALLFAVYIFDLFTETAYLLPGAFVIFVAAGYGAVIANQRMRAWLGSSPRATGDMALGIAVAALDLILVFAFATELGLRLSAEPRESEMVTSLEQITSATGPKATIVSNISLQFLELYIPGDGRKFIGLNSRDPGETFTDYHLNRLFAKRALGWKGQIPLVLFADDTMNSAIQSAIGADARASGAFLLLAAPESQEYSATLNAEVSAMSAVFSLEPILQNRAVALFRITPK